MRTAKHNLLALRLVVVAIFLGTARGAVAVKTFRLETSDRAQAFGPFQYRTGSKVFIGKSAFTVTALANNQLSFRNDSTGRVSGPFDLVPGRIVNIAGKAFTLIDVRTIDGVVPDPPRPPPVRPPPQYRIRAREPRGMSLGAEVALLDSVLYDARISAVGSEPRVALERSKATAFLRGGIFTCSLSASWGGEWDGGVSGTPFTFEDAQLEDGQGWSVSLGVRDTVFQREGWVLDAFGELSYASEDLTLSYGLWTTTQVAVPESTNGAVRTIYTFLDAERDVTLTEWVARVGVLLGYRGEGWSCYAGVEGIPVAETTLDATIEVDGQSYDMEFDQSYPVSALGSVEVFAAGLTWYLRGKAGQEAQVAFGAWRDF